MSNFRLDLLPLAKPTMMGLPFHGRVLNASLALPGGFFKTYRSLANLSNSGQSSVWAGGEALAVAGAGAAVRARTPAEIAADTAKGYNWKAYALLSGIERGIAGSRLGEHAWLYHDGHATWKLRAAIVRPATDNITIRIYLSQLFGFFCDDPDVTMTSERLLASLAFVPLRCLVTKEVEDGVCDYETFYSDTDADLFVFPKRDGSAALISIGFENDALQNYYRCRMGNAVAAFCWNGNTTFGDWTYGSGQETVIETRPYNTGLAGVLKVVVSGTGSLVTNVEEGIAIGDGISAGITLYQDTEDLDVITFTPVSGWRSPECDAVSPVRAAFWPPLRCECGSLSSTTTVEVQKFLFGYDQAGNEINATLTHTLTLTYTDTPSGDCYSEFTRDVAGTHSYVFGYAGKTIEIVYTSTGTQDHWPIQSDYTADSWTYNGNTTTEPPMLWWDSAFGDRTVLSVEFCWANTTLYSYYISPGGTKYSYETAVSTLGSDVPYPTIIKLHGFVANHPVDDALTYAGAWPKQVFWI